MLLRTRRIARFICREFLTLLFFLRRLHRRSRPAINLPLFSLVARRC